MGLTNTQKIVLSLVVFLVLLIGWGMFPLFFKWIMVGIGSKETELKDFGSLGDIYGSLNTLFTSATLAFVIYSTILQRQANKDARDAMADQLQQAKDATNEQLQQAREATDKQLELAQSTHDAQMRETKCAIFSNMFYSLLSHKRDLFSSIKFNRINIDQFGIRQTGANLNLLEIMRLMSNHFTFNVLGPNAIDICSLKLEEVIKGFYDYGSDNFDGSMNTIISYFLVYVSIWELIRNSDLVEEDEKFFKNILRNSMFQDEQIILFWITPMFAEFKQTLINSEIFNQFQFQEKFRPYALKHYDASYFANINWKIQF